MNTYINSHEESAKEFHHQRLCGNEVDVHGNYEPQNELIKERVKSEKVSQISDQIWKT